MSRRYCVIGAGAAGVSAFQQLRAADHDVQCFEKTDRVGGHWHTDYDALHLITSRDMTHFEGFPMPSHYPHFPRRDQVRQYIESYAAHHGLYDAITFNTEVVSVTPVACPDRPAGSAGWQVETSRGDEGVFDGVLVANGHLWSPRVPTIRGDYTGTAVHSSGYTNAGELPPGRVLVIGAGNSACDIAADLAAHRRDVDIVIRKGIHFQPKTYFGMPRAQVPFLADFTPPEQDLISRLLARVSIGQAENYPGMPTPVATTLADGPTTVNDLLLYWIHHGRIGVKPAVDHFDGATVHFTDISSADYQAVIYATGFDVSLPFLQPEQITWQERVPLRTAGGILPVGAEQLYFVGLIGPRGPQIPVYGMQTGLILEMIDLHDAHAPDGLSLAAYFASLQEPETRIDVVRATWNDQIADTRRILTALRAAPFADPASTQKLARR